MSAATASRGYRASATLPLRVELVRQLRRRRTLVAYLIVLALPIIVALAIEFGPMGSGVANRRIDGDSGDLIGLATAGATNFSVAMFFFAANFLLLILIAMFCGDTVSSEASWSSLRYLLAAPVPRRRLLRQKLVIGLVLSAGTIVVMSVSAYLIGLLVFGNDPLQSPVGGSFDVTDGIWRIAAIGGYIFVSLLFAAGIAFLVSVLTDVPLAAVGAAVVLTILSSILDAIDTLGGIRLWLPTHFGESWLDLLSSDVNWNNMARGAAISIVYAAICIAVAVFKFDRKDVVS